MRRCVLSCVFKNQITILDRLFFRVEQLTAANKMNKYNLTNTFYQL